MTTINELKRKREKIMNGSKAHLANMNATIEESKRVAQVAKDSKIIFDGLDNEFETRTGLNGVDVAFLFFATSLQCARQYFVSNDKFRFKEASDGDKFIKKLVLKSYEDILLQPVLYDAFKKHLDYQHLNTGISGANHRYTTLGHDPLLG